MNPLSFSEAVSLGSLAVAAIALITNFLRGAQGSAARDQLVSDKLDRAVEMSRETRDTVREMSRKLDDHGLTLAKHTEQIQTIFNRLDRVEKNCDLHHAVGSTD